MRDMPVVLRWIINIFLYFVYLGIFSFIFSFAFPLILQILDKPLLSPHDQIFERIQIFIAILVLLISLIFRKSFYIIGRGDDMIVLEEHVSKTKPKFTKHDDEEIKIYVDR